MPTIQATAEQRQMFTKELAKALGESWTAEIDWNDSREYFHTRVTHVDGYGVHIQHEATWNGKPMRIRLSGVWPVDVHRQIYTPSNYIAGSPGAHAITVAADKAIAKVATDIKIRFLPTYLEQYAKCKERAEGANTYEAATRRTMEDLKGAIVGRTAQHGPNTFYPEKSHVYQVTAQGDSVRFEAFSCPVQVAIFLLKAAREIKG